MSWAQGADRLGLADWVTEWLQHIEGQSSMHRHVG